MAKIPMYRAIAGIYRDKILAGEMAAGEKFPTRREMVSLYGVSRHTADKVMEQLKHWGMTVSLPRSLTTVASSAVPKPDVEPPMVPDLANHATAQQDRMAAIRATGNVLRKGEIGRILKSETVPCPADVAGPLQVEDGSDVLLRHRVVSREGTPTSTSWSYYPPQAVAVTPELATTERIREGAWQLAAKRLGASQATPVEYVTSRMATDEEMELLEIGEPGRPVPVTEVVRVVTLDTGLVIEVATKVTEGSLTVAFRSGSMAIA